MSAILCASAAALFHGDAVVGKVDDAQAGGGGSFQNAGTGALDIAAGADADDEIGAADAGRGHFHFGGGGVVIGGVETAAGGEEANGPGYDFDPARIGLAEARFRFEIFRWHGVIRVGTSADYNRS